MLIWTKRTISSDTERWFSVFKLIRVGIAAACIQCIVAVSATIFFVVVMRNSIVGNSDNLNNISGLPQAIEYYIQFLRYMYFLLALGIIFTHGRWTKIATEDIRRASHEVNPFAPSRTTDSIYGQLMIVTICFAIPVLCPPPYFVEAIVNFFESKWISSAVWSGATSVAMVAFGVRAAAAKRAMQEPHTPGC